MKFRDFKKWIKTQALEDLNEERGNSRCKGPGVGTVWEPQTPVWLEHSAPEGERDEQRWTDAGAQLMQIPLGWGRSLGPILTAVREFSRNGVFQREEIACAKVWKENNLGRLVRPH